MRRTLLGALVLVALGSWLLTRPQLATTGLFSSPTFLFMIGLTAILLFGLAAVVLVKKMADPSPGLVLDQRGLLDNASGVSAGRVLWSDITELNVLQLGRQKIILVFVRNPQLYIDRQDNAFKRQMMQLNLTTYGTPVSLSATALAIDFDTLYASLQQRLAGEAS